MKNGNSRAEIIRAGAEQFMQFGFAATTIDAIAKQLGATKGRVYHHFRSKFDLYISVQRTAMESLLRDVSAEVPGPGNPADRLYRMALRHTETLLKNLPIHKVAVQGLERHTIAAAPPRYRKSIRDVIRLRDEYEQMFAEVIDEGIRAGLFVDLPPRVATKPFFGALNWATIWYTRRRLENDADLEEIATILTDFAVRGLMKGDVEWNHRLKPRSQARSGTKEKRGRAIASTTTS